MFLSVFRLEVSSSCTGQSRNVEGQTAFYGTAASSGGTFSPFRSRVAPQRLIFCVHGSTSVKSQVLPAVVARAQVPFSVNQNGQQVETAARLDNV